MSSGKLNMPQKDVLLDSSSAIILNRVNLVERCAGVYNLIITQSVNDELTKNNHRDSAYFRNLIESGLIIMKELPSDVKPDDKISKLDMGEREIILLYLFASSSFK